MDSRLDIWTDLNTLVYTLFDVNTSKTYQPLAKLETVTTSDAWSGFSVLENMASDYEASNQTYTDSLTFSLWLIHPISSSTTTSDLDDYMEKVLTIRDNLGYKKISSSTLHYNITDVVFSSDEPYVQEFLDEMSLFVSVIVVNIASAHTRTNNASS